jgi:predicted SprT family Zn-dependent metalloprotease
MGESSDRPTGLSNPLSVEHLLLVRNLYRELRAERPDVLGGLPSGTSWIRWRYLREGTIRTLAQVRFRDDDFTLSINRYAFDQYYMMQPIILKGLIHHELLHIVCGSEEGHGPMFTGLESSWEHYDEYRYQRAKFVRAIERIERDKGRLFKYICPNCSKVLFRTRRMAPDSACRECCKTLNNGVWCESYVLIEQND